MKDYFDFTNYEKNLRVYGGQSGRKLGIIFNGTNYLLKFPGNIELKNIKNILSPYSNSSITEYIGSHIYEILNIPVHETLLGKFSDPKEHIVVACKDFNKTKEDRFLSFGKIKTTFIPHFTDSNGNDTNGNGTDLYEILLTIEQHPIFELFRDKIKERFWQMFIIDCLIGNSDRNNGNWGIIQHYDDSFSIAPVFDNGSCLHNTWDENKIKFFSKELDSIIDNQTCVFSNKNKKLNPTKFIQEYKNDDCTNVFISLYPKIEKNIGLINNFIEELPDEILNIPCVSKIKKEFYKSLINKKFERSFTKIYSELTSKNHILSSQEQRSNEMSELKYTKNQDIVFHGTDNPLVIPEGTILPLGVTPTHCYVFKDGTICKSVTQVLENQEFADNFSQLSGNAKIIADEAAQFGTLVHNTVEKYLKSCEQGHYTFNKDKDYQKLQNIIKELIPELYNEYRIRHTPKGSLEKIADKTGKEMTWGESISDHATFILQKIDSLNLKYAYPEQILALRQPMPVAGTSDLIGVKEDGRVIIVDYKTGNKSPIKEEMQVNFYAKMLEINTYQDDKEAGTIADELITINSREKEVYKYQKKNTSLIADILLAEKEDKKLSEVITCPTKGLEQLYDNKLSEACDKRRDIMLMRANFLSEHPDFEEQYNIYTNLLKEEDKVGKDVIKEAITELGLPKITREDFSATLSNRTTKTVDLNLLLEKYPQAYAECVSEIKTPVLNITTNKEFFKEQVKRKMEQKNNNIRML